MNRPMPTEQDEALPDSGLVQDSWERFVRARTSDAFCSAWLALICEKFPHTRQAAVLVEAQGGQAFVPIAVWPTAHAEMARMSAAVQRAIGDRRAVVMPVAEQPGLLHVAMPLSANERIAGAVVLEVMTDADAIPALLRELHWGSAWLSNLLGKRDHDAAVEASARSLGVLEAIATTLRHERFQQALFDLCNELRHRFACTRVAIGLVREAKVTLVALSEAATFEKSSPLVQAYVAAMGEACDLAQPIESQEGYRAHAALLQRTGSSMALSLPIAQQARCLAVLTLERADDQRFTEGERKWLEAFVALSAPVVAQRRDAERSSLQRLGDESRRFLKHLLGPRHLVWKVGAALAMVALAFLIFLPISYRVTAKTITEGEIQRVAAAPFEGFLTASFVRAGDAVSEGQVLAQLDDHDLQVERAKWASDRDQYDNKLREAMAQHDLTAIQVVSAQRDEAQAQLDLLNDKLARTKIRAPYNGVVVSGDLSQQIGTPVEVGKKLFEIAPLHNYRIILQVDERDIGALQVGQPGELVMHGLAGAPMPFTVAKIMPVATAQDGKNVYRVEARLTHGTASLLPGMEGVGKVSVGRRKLGWVLLHSLFDWLRLSLWNWGL